jgi:hypothetical protein
MSTTALGSDAADAPAKAHDAASKQAMPDLNSFRAATSIA